VCRLYFFLLFGTSETRSEPCKTGPEESGSRPPQSKNFSSRTPENPEWYKIRCSRGRAMFAILTTASVVARTHPDFPPALWAALY
jgi:hypothetical protein